MVISPPDPLSPPPIPAALPPPVAVMFPPLIVIVPADFEKVPPIPAAPFPPLTVITPPLMVIAPALLSSNPPIPVKFTPSMLLGNVIERIPVLSVWQNMFNVFPSLTVIPLFAYISFPSQRIRLTVPLTVIRLLLALTLLLTTYQAFPPSVPHAVSVPVTTVAVVQVLSG